MHGSKIYNNKLLNILHQTPIKLNKALNYLNPNFCIQKVTKKILSKIKTKAIKKGQLLPFAYGSDVFLAVKIFPLSVAGDTLL